MTTLARMSGVGQPVTGRRDASAPVGTSALVRRIREECDRQVPFSPIKLLLREAASTIERLEAEAARVAAELAGGRATRQAP